jgi:hypothetical protein
LPPFRNDNKKVCLKSKSEAGEFDISNELLSLNKMDKYYIGKNLQTVIAERRFYSHVFIPERV